MKKIIIFIPVFNDWDSVKKLIVDLNNIIEKTEGILFECCIINDGSTAEQPNIKKPKNINSLRVFNMLKNKGHARCNAFALKYAIQNEKFDYIILMDGDGEDRPIEIIDLVNQLKKTPNYSVVAKRIKRSEGPIFRFLYFMHKIITLIFTGKKINFGNYSCLTRKDVEAISSKASLWNSYSGTVKKYIDDYQEINSVRGIRYFGPSKMSLISLMIHSFSIIAVFKYHVFLRSIFIILLLIYLISYIGIFSIIAQLILVLFNLVILMISFRESKLELFSSGDNLKNIKEITH